MTVGPPDVPVPEAVPARLLNPALIPRLLFPAARHRQLHVIDTKYGHWQPHWHVCLDGC